MKVFIFGAGASVHAGYPLTRELWSSMVDWVQSTFPDDHDFVNGIATMNREFDLSKSFELVLTDLDNRIAPFLAEDKNTPPDRIREKVMLVHLRPQVERMIIKYFDSIRHKPAELYRAFAREVLADGDAVITFNYDLAIDRELRNADKWNIGNGYGFEIYGLPLADSPCKLYKLHGSTNWRAEIFQGSTGLRQVNLGDWSLGQRPVIEPSEFEYLGYKNIADPMCHQRAASISALIMPAANKRFYIKTSFGAEWSSFWNALWFQAGDALKIAEEIYLVGYTIPEYDGRAIELLTEYAEKDTPLKVCCRSRTNEVIEALKRIKFADVLPIGEGKFEQWLALATKKSEIYSSPL